MKLKYAVLTVSTAFVVFAFSATSVLADGQYGGSTTNPSEQPREEVTHVTVQADLGDNLLAVAAVIGGSAIVFYILSKVTARVYLMD